MPSGSFVDPQVGHNPATGTAPPASWGDTVRDDLVYLNARGPFICTAATRPAGATEGDLIYQTDTNTYLSYDGSSWWTVGAAGTGTTSSTITVTQSGTRTSSTNVSRYRIINGVCEWWFRVTITQAGSAGSGIYLSLPVNTAQGTAEHIGAGMYFRNAASVIYAVTFEIGSGNTIGMHTTNGTNNVVGATPSFATANFDEVRGHVRYLVASAA